MNRRVAGPPPERNITLIGMPGAGKSTVGVVLAKKLSLTFVDTDILIQARQGRSLQQILESDGYKKLRQLEEQEQRFREQQAMRMCAKARMLNEEILNSLEY